MRLSKFLEHKKVILIVGSVLLVALTSFGVAAYLHKPTDESTPSTTTKSDTTATTAVAEQKKNNDQSAESKKPKDSRASATSSTSQVAGSNTSTATPQSPPAPQGYKPWQPPVARDFTLSRGNTITLSPGSVSGTITATMTDGSVVSWHGSPRVYQGNTPPEAVGTHVVAVIEHSTSYTGSAFNFHIWVKPDTKPATHNILISAYDNPGATISSKWLSVVIQ